MKANMGTKPRPPSADVEKGEIGEIDTRAPFESVKAAVSLFGEVRFSSDKSAARKPKAPQAEVIKLLYLSKLSAPPPPPPPPPSPFFFFFFFPVFFLVFGVCFFMIGKIQR